MSHKTLPAWTLLTCLLLAPALAQESPVPATQPTTVPSTQPALVIITRDQWGSRPLPFPESRRHVPKIVTIHHAGVLYKAGTDPVVSVRNLQTFSQRDKKWADIPYHFIIAPNGNVFECRDVNYEPDTNTNYPLSGTLNIELMGNFNEQRVSPEQLRATALLAAKLCTDLKLDPDLVRGHKDAAPGQTDCPGHDFYRYLQNGSMKTWITQSMRGEAPQIEELPPLPNGPTTRISTSQPVEAAN